MALNSCLVLIASIVTLLIIVHPTLQHQQRFTTNLIHRDYSPSSPFYSLSLNQYERLRNAVQRSKSKINRFKTSSSNDAQSQIKSSVGDYLMELSYGTPPVSQLGVIDTGSDLIWTQCQPCVQCYKQDLPIFDPSKSSTYMTQSCDSQVCQSLDKNHITCSGKGNCSYSFVYGDSSHTKGDLATDTITFKSGEGGANGVSFPKVSFGCGHNNGGIFESDESGIVGLGGGPLSLVSQLGSSIGGKFSYCLIPYSKEGNYTSTISFGTGGQVSGPGVISTPIVKGQLSTFYYLTLNGLTVEKTTIPFYRKSSSNNNTDNNTRGNLIIDSGTTLTILPSDMVSGLKTALENAIKGEKVDDPSGNRLQLCYKTTKDGAHLNIPNVTMHFDGGDLVLKPKNTFFGVADGVVCLAFSSVNGMLGNGILGNVAQMDFLVGYDTMQGKVSFEPMDCTKQQ